ncbi:O-antigen ligase family protein [Metasolibacillus meyeri]|uniref:O-antigen ligase family protein n=1 Tax=Metasolibacillus meyeri TaxID=1071052 RepID=A0AAW9NGL1_9BACL|nr:O-antigen ligase family protein [Metasolibacillus meyeri]MEC1177739.1 O-antigen ligase family protein [Metasolibacillus meyeri]
MTSFYKEIHKSDTMSDEKENAQSRANVDKWIFRLLLLLIGVMPLIVLANVEQVISPLISNKDVLMSGTKGELFTHFKALFVVVVTLIAGALLLSKVFFMGGTIRKTFLNYALATFAIMIVISTIASPSISVALSGLYNRSDGAISWLCYITLMFIAMNIEYPKNVMKYILYTMMPFVAINLFIITMNFYGKDLLQYGWMQWIVSMTLPEGANIGEGSQLVGTLNQWNYMSGMFAIMTVMYLMAAVLEKVKVDSYGYLVFSLMSFAVLLMSISTSGFVTFTMLLPVILFVAFTNDNKINRFVIIVIFIVASAIIFHILASKEARVWTESIGFVIKSNPYVEEKIDVSIKSSNYNIKWMTKAYAAESFELPELPAGKIGAASGRVYIWSKALELVKGRPIVGYGMDTLIYNFPHTDIETRANFWRDDIITDKPHSLYIGWLYGTGIIGFFSVIGVILYTLIKPLKEVYNKREPILWIIGIAWGAYLIQGVFNDSLPSISAPMWILAGIMIAYTFTNKEISNGRNN